MEKDRIVAILREHEAELHRYDDVSDRDIWASIHNEVPALALAVKEPLNGLRQTSTGGPST